MTTAETLPDVTELLEEYVDVLREKGLGDEEMAFRERWWNYDEFQLVAHTAHMVRAQFEYEIQGGDGPLPRDDVVWEEWNERIKTKRQTL